MPASPHAAVHWIALVCILLGSRVRSQSSNVTSCLPNFTWTINSLGQTPCLVGAYLESTCGTPFQVNAIPVGTHYLGPTTGEVNLCFCSTVVYSLVSACGFCQGRLWSNWTTWAANCPTVSIGSPFPQPIPDAVQVPVWAYIDVRTLDSISFDPAVASAALTAPLPSSTSSFVIPTLSQGSIILPTVTGTTQKSGRVNAGAIAGGIVGGVIFLAALGLLGFWFLLRKRKAQNLSPNLEEKPQAGMIPQTHNRQGSQIPMLHSFGSPPTPPSYNQSVFDPSEMGAMPMTPSSAVHTTLPSRRSFDSLATSQPQHSQFGSLLTQPRGYTGAAELS